MILTGSLLTAAFGLIGLTQATPIEPRQANAGFYIKSRTFPGTCLGTTSTPGNDVPLYHIPCTNPISSFVGMWEIAPGNNNGVKLKGTNFCLDAGSNPQNGGPAKLYTCYSNLAQQTWYQTNDNHIAITGGTVCLSSNGQGCGLGGCAPGTSTCSADVSQQWDVVAVGGGTTPPPTSPPPTTTGRPIHFNGDTSRCIRPGTRAVGDGGQLYMGGCLAPDAPFASLQYYDIQRGSGQIKLSGSNLCLGVARGQGTATNGAIAALYDCDGLPNQKFWYTAPGDDHIAVEGGNLCLDVRREDGQTLQFWQCGTNNQQKFTL